MSGAGAGAGGASMGGAAAIRWLEPGVGVAPQLAPAELAGLAAAGVRAILNNRPDDEAPGQPSGAAIAAAATAAGLGYAEAVMAGGLDAAAVAAMRAALERLPAPVVAYCRSGWRSALLWAAARASAGADPEALIATARAAGHELGPAAAALRALKAR